jgi:N-ethylmaleimide reductase
VLGDPASELVRDLRTRFGGPLIANTGFSSVTALDDVERIIGADLADLVAVGREFIANPDLAERWRTGAALNEPDAGTFYGGGAEGYTDYPTLSQA